MLQLPFTSYAADNAVSTYTGSPEGAWHRRADRKGMHLATTTRCSAHSTKQGQHHSANVTSKTGRCLQNSYVHRAYRTVHRQCPSNKTPSFYVNAGGA